MKGYLEELSWIFRVRIWYKIKYHFNHKQRMAMAGKIPMEKDVFWSCLDVFYLRHDMRNFRALWGKYPHFVREKFGQFEADLADPTSKIHLEYEAKWAELKAQLEEDFGADWVRENFK